MSARRSKPAPAGAVAALAIVGEMFVVFVAIFSNNFGIALPLVFVLAAVGIGALWYGQSLAKSKRSEMVAFIASSNCRICGNKMNPVGGIIQVFFTDPKVQNPQAVFHEFCYREALRSQRKRCLNCKTPLYSPRKTEFEVPVFANEKGQLFCSQKCSETYRPLEGLAVSLPSAITCSYCKSVYSSSLTKCPSCGASRTRPAFNLMKLSPSEFELKIAELLIRMGYSNVTRVGGAGDRAVDITAQRKDEFNQVLTYAVQCKRYDSSSHVGSQEMQVFCSMISRVHGCDRGIYVTTSSFTSEAVEIAQKFGVTLVDGKLLEDLLLQYG